MQETPETREKLGNAIRDLQAKGDTQTIDTLVNAYKQKYKSGVQASVQDQREKLRSEGKAVSVSPDRVEPTGVGKAIRGVLNPAVNLVARPFQAIDLASNPNKQIQDVDIKSGYFGDIKAPRNAKDVIKDVGRGAELVSMGVGAGAVKGVAGQAVKGAVKEAAKVGAIQGAKSGALGGFGGALASDNQSAGNIIGSTLGGAALGGALGAGGGALSAKVAQGVARRSTALPQLRNKIATDDALEAITPKLQTLRTADRLQAIEEGRINTPTLFSKGRVAATDRDREIADSIVGLVKKGDKNVVKNVTNLNQEIAKRSRELDTLVETQTINPVSIDDLDNTFNQLKNESDFLFTSDANSESAYDSVIGLFKKKYAENGGNLLEARRAFDREIKSKFPNLLEKIGKGEIGDRARVQAVADIRESANDLVANSLPEGNPLRQELRHISNMYKARKVISRNAIGELNDSNIKKFVKSPAGRALGGLFTLVGGGLVAGKVARASNQ